MNSRAPSGRGRHEHRRLDLDEALLLHRRADRRVDRRADAQVALHPLAADVEVAVLQPCALGDGVGALVDRERRRLGGVEHLDRRSPAARSRRSASRSLTFSCGRAATMPVTRTTYSARTSTELSTTHWVTPVWSRTSTNASFSPCSRRRRHPAAQADGLPDVLGAQLAALVGSHRGAGHERAFFTESIRSVRGAVNCTSSPRSGRIVTTPCCELVGADDHGDGGAAAVGGLHLALHAAVVVRAVGARCRRRAARR